MVQARSTFWFWRAEELQLVTQTETQINVQGSYSGQTPLASNPVRSGQTWRSTSRPQLRSKSNLIPGKSLILAPCSPGMATPSSGAVLFYSRFPPYTRHSRHRKIKTCIVLKALPFSPFAVCVDLRSESSWLEPSESPSPLSLAPTAARWRRPRGHRWLWPSQTDGHIESPSSGQFSPSPESPPPAAYVRTERREEDWVEKDKKQRYMHKPKAKRFISGSLSAARRKQWPQSTRGEINSHTLNTNYMALNTQINIKWPVRSPL